jgi:GMP reductase
MVEERYEYMQKVVLAREYNYQDVYLRPRKTIVGTRKDCDVSVEFGGRTFAMPIFPANMKSIVNEETCEFLARKNLFYTMHRFGIDLVAFTHRMQSQNLIASISIGVNEDTYSQLDALAKANLCPEYITLDVANGWCLKAEKMIKYVKSNFCCGKTFLIVGNVATKEACEEIHSWGADAIKAGIAGGKVCITKNKTGFHRPMVSTVLDCAEYCNAANVPLIADGGIVEHGDIAKAIACGADMVMAGSLFAGFDQSAGDVIEVCVDGKNPHRYKEYYGSASQFNKGEYKNVEGKKILVDYKGSMEKMLTEIKEDLQSSVSYSGGTVLSDLINAELVSIN